VCFDPQCEFGSGSDAHCLYHILFVFLLCICLASVMHKVTTRVHTQPTRCLFYYSHDIWRFPFPYNIPPRGLPASTRETLSPGILMVNLSSLLRGSGESAGLPQRTSALVRLSAVPRVYFKSPIYRRQERRLHNCLSRMNGLSRDPILSFKDAPVLG
jgi:hypothetical protein